MAGSGEGLKASSALAVALDIKDELTTAGFFDKRSPTDPIS